MTKLIYKKPKICFISPSAYPILSKKKLGLAGGAELQQNLISKELVNKGYQICFITSDFNQDDIEIIDKISIYKIPKNNNKYIFYYIKEIFNLIKIFLKIKADIYYIRGHAIMSGITTLLHFFNKTKIIFSVSHDYDIDGTRYELKNNLRKFLYKIGILYADVVIAQSIYQQKVLKKKFRKDSILIKNVVAIPKIKKIDKKNPLVLWVSSIKGIKKPEVFLELAKKLPEIKFQITGGSTDEKFYDEVKKSASNIENLIFTGFIPYHEIHNHFDKASIFVNTSDAEGFPNTFLQAWSRSIPIVSLNVDPDEIICKYKLGFHSKTFEQMINDIKLLNNDVKLRNEMGQNGREYIIKEHKIDNIIDRYEKLFNRLYH
jgi:glycosyltransferase involved in cell wall biosynthesis